VPSEHWKLVDLKAHEKHKVRLILVIKNDDEQVENLKRQFDYVSDPLHPKYGQHMTYDEIHQQVLNKTIENGQIVENWLKKEQNGDDLRVTSTAYKEFLVVETPVHVVNRLFETTLSTYQHQTKRQITLKAKQFQLPKVIDDKIDHIVGLSQFPLVRDRRLRSILQQQLARKRRSNAPQLLFLDNDGTQFIFEVQLICFNRRNASNAICGRFQSFQIVLQNLLTSTKPLILTVTRTDANCAVCSEATGSISASCDAYDLNDDSVLCRFFVDAVGGLFHPYNVTLRSEFIIGGKQMFSDYTIQPFEQIPDTTPNLLVHLYNVNTSNSKERDPRNRQAVLGFNSYYNRASFKFFAKHRGKNYNVRIGKVYGTDYSNKSLDEAETSLDIEYMAAMGSGILTDYFYPPPTSEDGFIEFFAQLAQLEKNKTNVVPLVYSISYGGSTRSVRKKLLHNIDVNFMKMGLSGKTVFVSSGDDGVSTDDGVCRQEFLPDYPTSSSYVTSVGGTQLVPSKTNCRYIPEAPNRCLEEIVAYTNLLTGCAITSGGGFSDYDSAPSYQKKAVQSYLSSAGKRLPPSKSFNRSNRAYPDISLLANNYAVVLQGNVDKNGFDGTSASSPAVAGLFSTINDQRLKLGMKPLGFLNPLLYQLAEKQPNAFYDIITGENNCNKKTCCSYGFKAQKGYDPVTGLGTINHGLFMKLLTQK
ncbi:unnamed protein product, partial [Didymodactylos carnosus]